MAVAPSSASCQLLNIISSMMRNRRLKKPETQSEHEQSAREQGEEAVLGLPDAVDERDDVEPHHQVSR